MAIALALLGCIVALAVASNGASAVDSTPEWKIVSDHLMTSDLGIGFVNDLVGYTAGLTSEGEPLILRTLDEAHTWNMCTAKFGADFFLLDLAACDETIVVTSVFGELYSDDSGNSFHQARGGGTSQSVQYVGPKKGGGKRFGTAGQYGRKNGVGVSDDAGRTYTTFDAGLYPDALARYAAFPTDSVWFVAGGTWPSDSGIRSHVTNSTSRPPRARKTVFQSPDGHLPLEYVRHAAPTPPTGEGYVAQITKTVDAGQTWETVFFVNNSFYPNDIRCWNETFCCFVAEADADSPAAGAHIFCTHDGGGNWTEVFTQAASTTEGYSLMSIGFGSDNLIWACGGELTQKEPSAWFLESTDGGHSFVFNTNPIPQYYALGMSVVNSKTAYAAVDNLLTQSSGVAAFHG